MRSLAVVWMVKYEVYVCSCKSAVTVWELEMSIILVSLGWLLCILRRRFFRDAVLDRSREWQRRSFHRGVGVVAFDGYCSFPGCIPCLLCFSLFREQFDRREVREHIEGGA
jgi:hypothetical protein